MKENTVNEMNEILLAKYYCQWNSSEILKYVLQQIDCSELELLWVLLTDMSQDVKYWNTFYNNSTVQS